MNQSAIDIFNFSVHESLPLPLTRGNLDFDFNFDFNLNSLGKMKISSSVLSVFVGKCFFFFLYIKLRCCFSFGSKTDFVSNWRGFHLNCVKDYFEDTVRSFSREEIYRSVRKVSIWIFLQRSWVRRWFFGRLLTVWIFLRVGVPNTTK